MPYLEFTRIDTAGERPLLPEDTYRAVVHNLEEKRTKSGDEMWRVSLRVLRGERTGERHRGQHVFDNWVFSPKALPRVKLICSRFGLDVASDHEVTPDDFLGKEVKVEVRHRRDPQGRPEIFVPFAGYEAAEPPRPAGNLAGREARAPATRQSPISEVIPRDEVPF